MLGKIEGRRRRGWQKRRWLHGITEAMDMNLGKLQEMVKDKQAWCAAVHGVTKTLTRLRNWTANLDSSLWFIQLGISHDEATVRTRNGTMNWFQIGKGTHQGCILSPCLLNFYAEYIMWNAGLSESQIGIKIVKRNINNLRYAENITLMAESEEELKSLLMRVKEESEKAGLNSTL